MPSHLCQLEFPAPFPIVQPPVQLRISGRLDVFCDFGFRDPACDAANELSHIGRCATIFLRRIVHLEPPYIASVLVAFAVAYVAARTPGYRGEPFSPSVRDFLLQFLYLGPWFGVPWINGVAWTLAIEFQYYLLMLLVGPLLLARSNVSVGAFFGLIVASSLLVGDRRAVFLYLPCFAVGFVIFLFHSRRIGLSATLPLSALFVGLVGLNISASAAFVAAASGGLIFLPPKRPVPLLSFLGSISYSLYLVHAPLGDRIINLAMRLPSEWMRVVGLAVAIIVALAAAVAMWHFVERPVHRLSRTLSLGRSSNPPSAEAARRES